MLTYVPGETDMGIENSDDRATHRGFLSTPRKIDIIHNGYVPVARQLN